MKTHLLAGGLGAIAVLASMALSGPVGQLMPHSPGPAVAAEAVASAYVKIVGSAGTGSGVDIGNGYILTAGHVATMGGDIVVVDDLDKTHKVTVLWVNTAKDLALLKLNDDAAIASAPLSCDKPVVGQHVRAYGYPLAIDGVFAEGKIVGDPISEGPWQSVMLLDLTIVPGMSGGALVNDAGQVVGINVGVMVYGALTGFGYAVPAREACLLMGRA